MRTTSSRSRANDFASVTLPATPTTSISGSCLRSWDNEPVSSWWSSTSRTRMGFESPTITDSARLGPLGNGRRPILAPRIRRETDNRPMRVALLGFGLIGGSIARAIHARVGDAWEIAAWSPSGQGPARAMAGGEIAIAANDPAQALAGAELVVLAPPPVDCIRLLGELHGDLRASLPTDAVVTDVASTKRQIVHRAAELDLRFVGGHPMAGTERSGYDAADPGLFVARPWVICTGADDAAVQRVDGLVGAVGARPVRMDAAAHDAAVAA